MKKVKDKPRFEILIPSTIFTDNKLTTFEALVEYMKDVRGLSYREIGFVLNRDERNIWTVYHRAKKKRGKG
jgi:hypothetical protein